MLTVVHTDAARSLQPNLKLCSSVFEQGPAFFHVTYDVEISNRKSLTSDNKGYICKIEIAALTE